MNRTVAKHRQSAPQAGDAQIVDCANMIVMPGFN